MFLSVPGHWFDAMHDYTSNITSLYFIPNIVVNESSFRGWQLFLDPSIFKEILLLSLLLCA